MAEGIKSSILNTSSAGGGGTVTSVGLSDGSSTPIYVISGSPVVVAGTLTFTLATQVKNLVFAGPSTGANAQPGFRALVGADLPNPSASTLGGIESYSAVANQWINAISTSGVPSSTQPAFSNISGQASLTTQVSGVLPIANGGTNSSAALNNNQLIFSSGGAHVELGAATNGQLPIGSTGAAPVLAAITAGSGISVTNGAGSITIAATGGSGTVTSVALSDGSSSPIYTISGSPVTGAGTLTFTLSTQTANKVFSGPTSGGAAQPTFRSLVGADLPNPSASTLGGIESYAAVANQWINAISTSGVPSSTQPGFSDISGTASLTTQVSGVLPIANGGTNSSTALNNNRLITSSAGAIKEFSALTNGQLAIGSTGAAPVAASITAGSGISVTNGAGSITIASTATGTVTSVALSDGSSTPIYTISGSPVTSSGTLTFTLSNQAKNLIFAGPSSGANAQPTFRALVNADIPFLTVTTKSGNYSITAADNMTFFLADTSGGAFTFTLPAPVSGYRFLFKDSTGNFFTNNLTVAPNAAEKIDGIAASRTFVANWQQFSLVSNGTDWFLD